MISKRFKKLPKKTNTLKAEPINNLLSKVKENCTTKFDESLDINILINNKQKKNEINLRSMVNLPSGTGKKVKVAVVCEEGKLKEAKDSGADLVGGDDLIEKIKNGEMNFEKLICSSSMMVKLSKLGKVLGPRTLPNFDNLIIIDGVQISFSKFISPFFIFSIKSSPPTRSAPKSFASLDLLSSHTTATFTLLPVPLGRFTIDLKLISFFFCLLFIKILISKDSSNFVVQFSFTLKSKLLIGSAFKVFVFFGNFENLFELINL